MGSRKGRAGALKIECGDFRAFGAEPAANLRDPAKEQVRPPHLQIEQLEQALHQDLGLDIATLGLEDQADVLGRFIAHIAQEGRALVLDQIGQGLLQQGERYIGRSIIESRFIGEVAGLTTVGNHAAIIPTITGRAWITAQSSLMLDPDDPWPEGYKIADTWPIDAKD